MTVLEATGEVIEDPIPLANISLEGTLQYSVQTSALSVSHLFSSAHNFSATYEFSLT